VVGRQNNKRTNKQRAITFSRVAEKRPKKKASITCNDGGFFRLLGVPVAQLPLNSKKANYATSIHAF
jgi:hypothetical protein